MKSRFQSRSRGALWSILRNHLNHDDARQVFDRALLSKIATRAVEDPLHLAARDGASELPPCRCM